MGGGGGECIKGYASPLQHLQMVCGTAIVRFAFAVQESWRRESSKSSKKTTPHEGIAGWVKATKRGKGNISNDNNNNDEKEHKRREGSGKREGVGSGTCVRVTHPLASLNPPSPAFACHATGESMGDTDSITASTGRRP